MSVSFQTEPNVISYEHPSIVVIDSHALTRSCLARILRSELQEFAILEIANARDFVSIVGRPVGLVALNIGSWAMTDERVIEDLVCLRRSLIEGRIMLLTQVDEAEISDAMVAEVTRYGVRGYITDATSIEITLAAIRLLIAGGIYFPRPVAVDRPDPASIPPEDIVIMRPAPGMASVSLTDRERQVLATLQRGASNKIIAHELNLSQNTVKVHLSRIMRKLNSSNRTETALAAQRSFANGEVPGNGSIV